MPPTSPARTARKPAASYPMHEAHPNEKVTIAADPCDDPEHCKFFRLEYVQHGFLPVRVIVTNDRDQPLVLDDVRIQFIPPDGGKEGAATDEDLNRRLFSRKSTQPTRIPLTPFSINKEPVDKKILNDDTDFGFASTVVPAHSTRAGYIFYDVRGIDDPVMKGAELYLKQIHYTDEHAHRTELFPFTLSFDTYLAAQPKPAERPKAPRASPRRPKIAGCPMIPEAEGEGYRANNLFSSHPTHPLNRAPFIAVVPR